MIRWALVALTVVIGVASSAFAREPIPVPAVVEFPAGTFIRGSYRAERDYAYRLDEAAYSHNVTRRNRWYEDEPRQSSDTAAYEITQTPITNGGYAAFVRATNRGKRVGCGACRVKPNGKRRRGEPTGVVSRGAMCSILCASIATTEDLSIQCGSVDFGPAPAHSACWTAPVKFSNGRRLLPD
jgi:formylglycine-generating enzyme required for sulfatase activity